MPTLDDAFTAVRTALVDHFGPTADDFEGLAPFEAMVAVLLDRALGGARWRAALDGLSEAGLLTPERLGEALVPEIADVLREKGISAPAPSIAPVLHLARWLVDHHGGRVESLFDPHRSTDWLRGELAALSGIGMTTADAVLLHALKQPSYPVDRATYRVLVRHDWLDPTATYDEARDLVVHHAAVEADVLAEDEPHELGLLSAHLAELAHGMEHLGRRFCRAAAPRCQGCPLENLLPEGGPREVDA